jgi:tetratricopeptide (TPR) repeat protein
MTLTYDLVYLLQAFRAKHDYVQCIHYLCLAQEMRKKEWEYAERHYSWDLLYLQEGSHELAMACFTNRDYKQAVTYFEERNEFIQKRIELGEVEGRLTMDLFSGIVDVADALVKAGEYDKALDACKRALALRAIEGAHVVHDDNTIYCINTLRDIYKNKKDFDNALKFGLEALELTKNYFRGESFVTGSYIYIHIYMYIYDLFYRFILLFL